MVWFEIVRARSFAPLNSAGLRMTAVNKEGFAMTAVKRGGLRMTAVEKRGTQDDVLSCELG